MWHEARKQERKIRGMLVDYRKRAERRRDFYEKIKADPTQFLQVHGRQCKIHLDPNIAAAADSPATMMPWQGHNDNLIDRFDVRAHLDMIPNVKNEDEEDLTYEERQINYERYRIIAQNSFLVISEEKFLKQLHLEEQFGYTENEPKKKKTGGAAIGFNYEDGTGPSQSVVPAPVFEEENSDDNSDSDLDVDLSINVSKLDQAQAHEMNRHGRNFGMSSNDFYSFLTHDLEEAESFRLAKEEEHEKALFSGRKSRRERRAHREKRLANRKISPPSYAARESPTLKLDMHDKSESRSPSPENAGKITFITSFGGEEEQMPSKPTYADKVKFGNRFKKSGDLKEERLIFRDQGNRSSSRDRPNYRKRHRERNSGSWSTSKRIRTHRSSSSDSRSPSRGRRSRSKSRSRSKHRSYSRNRRTSKSRSRSPRRSTSRSVRRSTSRSKLLSRSKTRHSRSHSNPRNRSKSNENNRRRSTSNNKSFSRSRSRSVSRSKSRSKSTGKSSSRSKSVKSSSSSSRSVSPSKKHESPPKPLPRYYGRRKSDQSSSELGDSSEEEENKVTVNAVIQNTNMKTGNSGTSTKSVSSNTSLSLQERLKRKRQALLNKQFKADKIAEQLKTEREKQEQQTREDELREMALKLRRRQRERRHAYDSDSSDSTSTSDGKTNVSSENKKSRSPSPKVREYRDTDYRTRDRDYKYRNDREQEYKRSRYSRGSSRERNDRYVRRTSKTRYDDKRHDERERDRYDRDDRDERRKDGYRDKRERSGKSLVDY